MDKDVIAQGLRDLVELQREQAEHSAAELIEEHSTLLAAGKCPAKIIAMMIVCRNASRLSVRGLKKKDFCCRRRCRNVRTA